MKRDRVLSDKRRTIHLGSSPGIRLSTRALEMESTWCLLSLSELRLLYRWMLWSWKFACNFADIIWAEAKSEYVERTECTSPENHIHSLILASHRRVTVTFSSDTEFTSSSSVTSTYYAAIEQLALPSASRVLLRLWNIEMRRPRCESRKGRDWWRCWMFGKDDSTSARGNSLSLTRAP